MKLVLKLFFTVALALGVLAGCTKETATPKQDKNDVEPAGSGILAVVISPGAASVKSGGISSEVERIVRDCEILVFDDSGRLSRRSYFDKQGTLDSSMQEKYSLAMGEYRVYAIINGGGIGGDVSTLEALLAKPILMDEYYGSDGFLHIGGGVASVALNQTTTLEIEALRLVSRIRLESVRSNLPETYTDVRLKGFLLCNVVANGNLGGTAAASWWYNRYGRSILVQKESIIDGSKYPAQAPELTWHSLNLPLKHGESTTESACNLYCMPNKLENQVKSWREDFSPCATIATLCVEVDGEAYYYPLRVNRYAEGGLAANTSYSISMTLDNLGSKDPTVPLDNGSLQATIKVANWDDGGGSVYSY